MSSLQPTNVFFLLFYCLYQGGPNHGPRAICGAQRNFLQPAKQLYTNSSLFDRGQRQPSITGFPKLLVYRYPLDTL